MTVPALIRLALLAGGAAALLVGESSRAELLRPAEAALSFILLAAVSARRTRADRPLLAAAAALFCGDLLYFVNGNLKILPDILFPVEEGAYTIYILAMAGYLLQTCRREAALATAEKITLGFLLAGFSWISAKYVLFPFFASGNFASPYFYATSTVYRATEALVVALAVLLGMKALSRYWMLTLNGLILLAVSSLALGYNTGVLNEERISFPFQEYGWLWGLLCLLAARTYPQEEENFARWHSARVRLVWLIFVFNMGLLAMLYATRALTAAPDAFHLSSLLLAVLGLWIVANLISFRISEDIHSVLDSLRTGSDPDSGKVFRLDIHEVELFAERLKAAYATIRAQTELSALAAVSAQVAHDIRSPLAALDSALRDLSRLPEDKRLLIRNATGRIRDIANNLLERNRSVGSGVRGPEDRGPLLLSGLIEPVITEKRLQYRDRSDVSIGSAMDRDAYGLFGLVDPVDLARVLSNLVNNSVEAMPGGGTVSITLSRRDGSGVITVRDDGKGIPPSLIASLGNRGATYGKKGGSGLGLYHARGSAEKWGGSLSISSVAGEGTEITLTVPLAPQPDWFASSLSLAAGSAVVILDDDATIHQLWKGRFDSCRAGERGVRFYGFSSPEALKRWLGEEGGAGPGLFLFDYELPGSGNTGLELAKQLGVASRTILATSRYEEPGIRDACRRLGIPLLPKNLAGLIPIHVDAPASSATTAVLIDDDPLARLTWKTAARGAGVELLACAAPAEAVSAAAKLPRSTPLYVDFELGAGLSGASVAAELRAMGFTDITLVTGHPPEHLSLSPRGSRSPARSRHGRGKRLEAAAPRLDLTVKKPGQGPGFSHTVRQIR